MFGSIETPKVVVSVQNRNNRNKRFVLDSAETSFGSSFGCFESKLVSLDTLLKGDLLIDTSFDPPHFSLDSPSKLQKNRFPFFWRIQWVIGEFYFTVCIIKAVSSFQNTCMKARTW